VSDDEALQRRPELDALPAVVGPVPVVVFDRLLNVVLASQLAERLYVAFRVGENLARFTFLDGEVHPELDDWPRKTRQVAAMLRECSGVDAGDAPLIALVGELSSLSREFATAWAAEAVERPTDVFEFRHPDEGRLRLRYHLLRGPGRGVDTVAIWHAEDLASLAGLRSLDT
jgi:hypothetical protein